MSALFALAGFFAAAATSAAEPRASVASSIEPSIVRIQVYRARWDWTQPWRVRPVDRSLGSGFLIEGRRILTNAHVVADARQILVKRHHAADPFVAEVVAIGNDCDLAILEVKDRSFYKGLAPLALGELPAARTKVTTYGYPLGGEEVSSTEGIVSRIEWKAYVHSGFDWHLVAQTDAAINPGNSGGPVVHAGKVVGVAFQGMAGFDNLGFFIPAPVVRHFLLDLQDGRYDGFPDGGFRTLDLVSPAFRRERALPAGKSGVVVDALLPGGTGFGALLEGDVLLAVEGQPIADDGSIALGEARVPFSHALDMKQMQQPVRFKVWRAGRETDVVAQSRRISRGDRARHSYGVQPRYLVYAGLVFMPLDLEYLKTWGGDWRGSADRELVWHHQYREWEDPDRADREVVVLARVLRHPVNSQLRWADGGAIVERVNGKSIGGLRDLADALAAGKGKFHVFEYESSGGLEVLEREKSEAAHAAINATYGIQRDRNL